MLSSVLSAGHLDCLHLQVNVLWSYSLWVDWNSLRQCNSQISHSRFVLAQHLVGNLPSLCFESWQVCNLRCQGSGSVDFSLISWVITLHHLSQQSSVSSEVGCTLVCHLLMAIVLIRKSWIWISGVQCEDIRKVVLRSIEFWSHCYAELDQWVDFEVAQLRLGLNWFPITVLTSGYCCCAVTDITVLSDNRCSYPDQVD